MDPGAVLPGKPTQFTVDASKTGEAPVKVEIETEDGKVPSRSIKPNGDGTHEVTYVPPPVGEPYLVSIVWSEGANISFVILTPTTDRRQVQR